MGFGRPFKHVIFVGVGDHLEPALLCHAMAELGDLADLELKNLPILSREITVGLPLECYLFGGHEHFIIIHSDQNRRPVGARPDLIRLVSVDHHHSPLRLLAVFLHNFLAFDQRIHQTLSFLLELANQLGNYLAVRFTVESDVAQVVFLYLAVAADYSIVHDICQLVLTVVRVRIPSHLRSACRPSRMPDAHVRSSYFLTHFLHKSIDAINRLTLLLRMLDQSRLDRAIFILRECDDARAVVASVLE